MKEGSAWRDHFRALHSGRHAVGGDGLEPRDGQILEQGDHSFERKKFSEKVRLSLSSGGQNTSFYEKYASEQ